MFFKRLVYFLFLLLMKRVLLDANMEIVPRYPVAAMFYAMAHRREHVLGPPVAILRIKISSDGQLRGFLDGSLISKVAIRTVAFKKKVCHENYKGLLDLVAHQMSEDVGAALLSFGYSLLQKEVLIEGVN